MNFFKKKLKVVTHDGYFHPDELFACATLAIWADKNGKKLKIIRTRDKDIIKNVDIVVDVGLNYDPDKNLFDHHQIGRAGTRENGIPYASFGLAWKKYGLEICESIEIANRIDKEFIIPIDAKDNGVTFSKRNDFGLRDYPLSEAVYNLNFLRNGSKKYFDNADKLFEKALGIAKDLLVSEIISVTILENDKLKTLEVIKQQNNPEILILDSRLEWHEAVMDNKNTKLVIFPRKNGEWSVQVARDDLEDYDSNRVVFPSEWCGLSGDELIKMSGIDGAKFCANGNWLMVVDTKENALIVAEKVLQINQN